MPFQHEMYLFLPFLVTENKLLMKKLLFVSFCLITIGIGCTVKAGKSNVSNLSATELKAQEIIDKSINVHGGEKYKDLNIEFDFRKRHYKVERKNGIYSYERIYSDENNQEIQDKLSNDTFTRAINGEHVDLSEKQIAGNSNSINSVVYFVLLPYFLNDPAVMKDYVGEETIEGSDYQKIKVTFKQNGGGSDFEDEYLYWINKKTYTMNYLAYNFHVNGGGARFRSAYNNRIIKGIRFADYINYKPVEKTKDINAFGELFQNQGLKELSKIETENIIVH